MYSVGARVQLRRSRLLGVGIRECESERVRGGIKAAPSAPRGPRGPRRLADSGQVRPVDKRRATAPLYRPGMHASTPHMQLGQAVHLERSQLSALHSAKKTHPTSMSSLGLVLSTFKRAMGIPQLKRWLGPHSERGPMQQGDVVVDGPALAYYILSVCSQGSRKTSPFQQPSYSLIGSTVIAWLDRVQECGLSVYTSPPWLLPRPSPSPD